MESIHSTSTTRIFISQRQLSEKMGLRTYGTAMTILGVLILCPDTLLLREVEDTDGWTVLLYRGIFFATFTLSTQLLYDQNLYTSLQKLIALGSIGLFAGIVQGISQVLFTVGVLNTAAANVLVINATNPVFSAILSFVILRETIPLKTIIVICISFGAIILVFSSDSSFGGDSSSTSALVGNLASLGAAVTIGLYFVLIRLAAQRSPDIDFLPCNFISGCCVVIAAVAAGQGAQSMSATAMGFTVLQGFNLALSFALLTIGPEFITAPEVSLYTLIETVIGPVLVYVGGFEPPPLFTVYGGIMLFIALAGHR